MDKIWLGQQDAMPATVAPAMRRVFDAGLVCGNHRGRERRYSYFAETAVKSPEAAGFPIRTFEEFSDRRGFSEKPGFSLELSSMD